MNGANGRKPGRQPRTPGHPRVRGVPLGRIIATRLLGRDGARGQEVIVEVGAPRMTPGREEAYCPYRILGLGDEVVRAAYGVDAVQALQLVMHDLGSALARHRELRFHGNSDLGFPDPEDLLTLAVAKQQR